jgi:hypothetical protein
MAEPAYQRLTRERINRQFTLVTASRVSLWLGGDHLLLVQRNGFTETCKRFYFRDIQAITVQQTARRTIWNAILTVPLGIGLIGLLLSASAPANEAALVVWLIFAGVFLLPFAVNNLRGTASECRLRTAVQTEELGSLSRVAQTRKVLDRIRPLIVAAQGQLAAQEVAARMQAAAQAAAITPGPEPPAAAVSGPPPVA